MSENKDFFDLYSADNDDKETLPSADGSSEKAERPTDAPTGLSVVEQPDSADLTPSDEPSAEPEKEECGSLAGAFDWVDSVVASIVAVVLVFTFLFRVVAIDGDSMNNTLENKDRVIIYDLGYTPKRGDIVVISRNASNDKNRSQEGREPIIKRVIATEGETVDIRFEDGVGYVYVNGVLLNESYVKEYISEDFKTYSPISFPAVVPEGCVFVLGDNRNNSLDSRSAVIGTNGMVDTRYIMGHAVLRIWPINKIGAL